MNKAIIFDLDGTLWDTKNQTYLSFNNVLKMHGYDEVTKEKVSDNFGNSREQSINHFFSTLPYEVADRLLEEIDNNIIDNLKNSSNYIYKGVTESLNLLSKKYNLYIVSNCAHKSYIESFLKAGNYYNYFKDYIAASSIPISKSEAIEKIINDNNIEQAIYVGDTEKDKDAAESINIPFIQCLYGFGKDLDCKYKINDISELYESVEKAFN